MSMDQEKEQVGDVPSPSPVAARGARRFGMREAVLAVVAVLAVIAAAIGFSLYAGARVPADAAAKVDDTYVTEESVADWIAQYRAAYRLEDDSSFASALLSQNLNVNTFRQNAVNQLTLSQLVNKRAEELGVTPTDDEAQAQVDSMKQSMSFGDDGVWDDTLSSYGLTEDSLLDQYRTNLAQQAVCERDVPRREASDDETLSYAKSYLAGTTQKHASRIVFVGDDADARAQECYEQLKAKQDAGGVDATAFSELARAYSDEDDVDETGGSLAWSGDDAMNDDVMNLLEDLDAGAFTGVEDVQSDDAKEIVYCDQAYTFPAAADFSSLDTDTVPASLMDTVSDAASDELWKSDCNAYLAKLLASAKITYYPMPDGATYDVDMSLASSQQEG